MHAWAEHARNGALIHGTRYGSPPTGGAARTSRAGPDERAASYRWLPCLSCMTRPYRRRPGTGCGRRLWRTAAALAGAHKVAGLCCVGPASNQGRGFQPTRAQQPALLPWQKGDGGRTLLVWACEAALEAGSGTDVWWPCVSTSKSPTRPAVVVGGNSAVVTRQDCRVTQDRRRAAGWTLDASFASGRLTVRMHVPTLWLRVAGGAPFRACDSARGRNKLPAKPEVELHALTWGHGAGPERLLRGRSLGYRLPFDMAEFVPLPAGGNCLPGREGEYMDALLVCRVPTVRCYCAPWTVSPDGYTE